MLKKERWPAKPGFEQEEWEEPRVVGNALGKRLEGDSRGKQQTETNHETVDTPTETQSKLGGTADGPSLCRVDPLRLLGNGVLPNTCERAIRILLERIHGQ